MATVKFYKTICRSTSFNLAIDHLHKLISRFSIEFIMELRLQYVSKRNVPIATIGRLGLRCFLLFLEKCKYFQPQNVRLDISKNETKIKQKLEWKTVKRARGCCVHIFLVYAYLTGPQPKASYTFTASLVDNTVESGIHWKMSSPSWGA